MEVQITQLVVEKTPSIIMYSGERNEKKNEIKGKWIAKVMSGDMTLSYETFESPKLALDWLIKETRKGKANINYE